MFTCLKKFTFMILTISTFSNLYCEVKPKLWPTLGSFVKDYVKGKQEDFNAYKDNARRIITGTIICNCALTAGLIGLGCSVALDNKKAATISTAVSGGISIFGLYYIGTGLQAIRNLNKN